MKGKDRVRKTNFLQLGNQGKRKKDSSVRSIASYFVKPANTVNEQARTLSQNQQNEASVEGTSGQSNICDNLMDVDNEPNEIMVVESDLPGTSDSRDNLSISSAKNGKIASTDETNDIGLYVSKMSETPDFKKFQLLPNHWKPPQNYRFPFSVHNNKGKKQSHYFHQQYLNDFDWLVFSDDDKGLDCKFM